jgi:exopolysaccharide production protein ExoZ
MRPSCLNWLRDHFELARGGRGQNVRPMEGVRGFAVFLVFLVHYSTAVMPWISADSALGWLAHDLRVMGRTGVDLFFILSGYLIYGSLISRPQPFLQFMFRRIERIYPAFAVVFLTYIGLSFIVPAESKIPTGGFDAAVYLLQNVLLLPGICSMEPVITVTWSLSYEMCFYVGIPLAITLLNLRARSSAQRVLLFAATAVGTVVWCATWEGHVRLIMFVAGILLYEAVQNQLLRAPRSITALAALGVGLFGSLLPLNGLAAEAFKALVLFVAFFIPCYTCISRPDSWLAEAFSWTPLRWLGNMSYSYYLLHGLALKAAFIVFGTLVPPAAHGWLFFCALLPVMFALTLIPTAALFVTVERPLSLSPQRRGRRPASSGERVSTIPVCADPAQPGS